MRFRENRWLGRKSAGSGVEDIQKLHAACRIREHPLTAVHGRLCLGEAARLRLCVGEPFTCRAQAWHPLQIPLETAFGSRVLVGAAGCPAQRSRHGESGVGKRGPGWGRSARVNGVEESTYL
jgi:hypothetical protein